MKRLRFIRSAQAAGFTLSEIKELVDLDASDDRDRARELAQGRVAALDAKIEELRKSREALAGLASACARKRAALALSSARSKDAERSPFLLAAMFRERPRLALNPEDCAKNHPSELDHQRPGTQTVSRSSESHPIGAPVPDTMSLSLNPTLTLVKSCLPACSACLALALQSREAPAMVPIRTNQPRRLADYSADYRMLMLAALATVAGTGGAFSAWALLKLIALATNIFWYGNFSYGSATITSRGPILVLMIPVLGGLIVGLTARYGSEKIRGHGIPEAIETILFGESKLSLKVALLKPISSAVSIGSGGPFGAEGPIIMTGGAIGSLFAQLFRLSAAERKTLLVAGATAGMTGIFGTPFAAIMLAVELLLFEWKPRSFVPVVTAVLVAFAWRPSWSAQDLYSRSRRRPRRASSRSQSQPGLDLSPASRPRSSLSSSIVSRTDFTGCRSIGCGGPRSGRSSLGSEACLTFESSAPVTE